MKYLLLSRIRVLALLAFVQASDAVRAQVVLVQTQAPTTLVQNVLMGPGVFASNVVFNGQAGNTVAPVGVGYSEIGRFNGTNSCIGLNSGVFLTTGVAAVHIPGPNTELSPQYGGVGAAQGIGTPDLDLSHLSAWPYWQVSNGSNIYSKVILEFDIIPMSDMISFRYVFSSEEYERWVCTQYNDVFGFFINGPGIPTDVNGPFSNNAMNIALMPGSLARVSINSVNSGLMDANNANGPWTDPFQHCFAADPNWQSNSQYYRYNGGQWAFPQPPISAPQMEAPYNTDPYYIAHNGMTVVLTASAAVQCGQTYHIKLALGNVGDSKYPSAVWLEGGSFTSDDRFSLEALPGPTVEFTDTDTIFTESNCDSVYLRFNRWGGFYLDEDLEITVGGTATNGTDILPALPATVHFNQLDSSVVVPIAVPVDTDGLEELVVNIITCDGLKVQTYHFTIDQEPPLVVTLDDQTGICPDTFTLTPTVTGGSGDPANYTYLWNTGETTPSITADVSVSTQFWVTVSDSCWALDVTDSAWVTLPVPDPLVVFLPLDTVIPCLWTADLVPVVTGAMGEVTYEWTEGGNVIGTNDTLTVPAGVGVVYTVEVTDECQRTADTTITVFTGPTPPLLLSAEGDTVMCAGMPMVLEVLSVSGGGGNYHYQWAIPPGTGPDSNSSIEVTVDDDTFYTVTITDDCGNTADTTLAAVVMDHPPMSLVLANDTAVCPDEEVPLWVIATGGAGSYVIEWTGIGSGSPVTWTAGHHSISAEVTVTDLCGETAVGSVDILVYPASASIDPDQLSETQWRFHAMTVPQTGVDIQWDLGDGNTSTNPTVIHNYTDYEAHWVVLRVETPEGCVQWDSLQTPPPSATIYFPNTFTPDGDGLNDSFGGIGRLVDEYELWVFDRWGRLAFHSTNMTDRWNGMIDGEEAKTEVYSYRYRAAGVSMIRQEGFGHITLLR